METITIVVLAVLAALLIQHKRTSARDVKRVRVRSKSTYRQTNVPEDRC